MNKTFTSNAEWPKGTLKYCASDVTTDVHETKGEAAHVCRKLEQYGLGGQREIFPLRTWVGGDE